MSKHFVFVVFSVLYVTSCGSSKDSDQVNPTPTPNLSPVPEPMKSETPKKKEDPVVQALVAEYYSQFFKIVDSDDTAGLKQFIDEGRFKIFDENALQPSKTQLLKVASDGAKKILLDLIKLKFLKKSVVIMPDNTGNPDTLVYLFVNLRDAEEEYFSQVLKVLLENVEGSGYSEGDIMTRLWSEKMDVVSSTL